LLNEDIKITANWICCSGKPARRTVFQDCTESEAKDSLEGFEWEL